MKGPHLKSIEISGFRSIDKKVELSLDAPVVLIHGQNGAGKTSLFSAIELALTGAIPSLERADRGYRKQLVTYGAKHGHLTLKLAGLDEVANPISVNVSRESARYTAALSPSLAQIYSERCYLPQTTLSQLLTIYGSDQGGVESPLSRFAADLLGLDRLDALQRGLYPARDARNIRPLVPTYRTLEENRGTYATEIAQIRRDRSDVEAASSEASTALEVELGRANLASVEVIPTAISRLTAEARTLAEQAQRVESFEAAWNRIQAARYENSLGAVSAAVSDAELRLAEWQEGPGASLKDLFLRTAEYTAMTALAITPSVDADLASVIDVLGRLFERASTVTSVSEQSEARLREIEDEAIKVRITITDLDRRIHAAGQNAPDLASALAAIIPHVHGDDCPVCHRDYSEISQRSLGDELRLRLNAMAESSEQLARDTAQRSRMIGRLAEIDRERDVLASALPSADDSRRLSGERAILESLLAEARALTDVAAAGASAMQRQSETLRLFQSWNRSDAEEYNLADELARLEKELGLSADKSELHQRLLSCKAAVDTYRNRNQRILAALDAAQQHEVRTKSLAATLERLTVAETSKRSAKAKADDAFRAARAIRDSANRLSSAVATARANVVSEVFNERLNSLWRDLFVRLAPDEQFIPIFDVPLNAENRVRPVLTTELRSGERGGSPGSMLSSGNLNTAALTLFLALHLTVSPKLPWLVLDDPVQSMDDVHIANFAALLRTLSKQHHRQILVAVHDRQLFDYLALEMSPAFPTDELITIELERSAGGSIRPKEKRLGYIQRPAIVAAA